MAAEPAGLSYPCAYPVKVFLRPDAEVEAALVAGIRAELAPGAALEVVRRPSSSARYICLTLRFTAQDAEQVGRIAARLRAAPGVLMTL
ncbi:MAG: DUF493 domain-containing protein [Nevskiaceae bacterium]|nr:MAG: DUF493 domain-containing protein [Nevskiaceae bacterium]TBR74443.1 MAG: DUF493 domain-containing protein [Nevskiaceae bacterium]